MDLETFQVLTPQIEKIKRFMEFQERCIAMLLQSMQDLAIKQVRRNNTDRHYNAITKLMDLLQKLDNLKVTILHYFFNYVDPVQARPWPRRRPRPRLPTSWKI